MSEAPGTTEQRVVEGCWGNRGGAGVNDGMYEGMCRARHEVIKLCSIFIQAHRRLEANAYGSLASRVLDHVGREGAALSGRFSKEFIQWWSASLQTYNF